MVYRLVLAFFIVAALLYRIMGITSVVGLSYDELFSWNIAANYDPLGIITQLIETDYHPPLYFLGLHYWIGLFGADDECLSFLSVIFSSFCPLIAYFIGKTYKNSKFGILLSGIFAFSYIFIHEAQNVRFYQMALMFALLGVLFCLNILKNFSKKAFIGLIVSNLALLYTQTTGLIFVSLELLLLGIFLYFDKKSDFKMFIKSTLITLFFYIPQFLMTIIQIYHSKQTFWHSPWEWSSFKYIGDFLMKSLFSTILPFSCEMTPTHIKFIILIIILSFLFYNFIKANDKPALFVALYFSACTLAFVTLNKLGIITLWCNENYFIIIIALFALCVLFVLSYFEIYFLCIILILQFYYSTATITTPQHVLKLDMVRFARPIKFIEKKHFDKGIIFSFYGDSLIKKYNKNLEPMGLDGDKLFTMYKWQNQAKMLFDVDFKDFSILQKKNYFRVFISNPKPEYALLATYNKAIDKLNKDEYFIILTPANRFISQGFLNSTTSDDALYNFNPKSTMASAKITNDVVKLANSDLRLKKLDVGYSGRDWVIMVYKKV